MATTSLGGAELVDRNATGTMLPSGTIAGTSGQNLIGTQNVQTSGTNVTSGGSATSNMTPQALAALQGLIQQLSDHPAVQEAAAVAQLDSQGMKTPQVVGSRGNVFVPGLGGFGGNTSIEPTYTDEKGRPTDAAGFAAAQARYNAAKQKIIDEGGIVAGGTAEIKAAQAQKQQLITSLLGEHAANVQTVANANAEKVKQIGANTLQQTQYTKEAAFNDASTLAAGYARKLAETIMPTILRAGEAAGTSGSATQALLANDAAARTAEAAAATGLNAASAYGQVSNALSGINASLTNPAMVNDNLSSTLTELMKNNTPALDALMQALNISKGAVQNTASTQVQKTSQNQTQNTNNTTTGTENKTQTGTLPQPLIQPVTPTYNNPTQLVQQPYQQGPSYMSITRTTPADPSVQSDYFGDYSFDSGL